MRLDDYIDQELDDERAERRRLAARKSYGVTDHLDDFRRRFESAVTDDTVVGSVSPSIFVGRSGYPEVSTSVLSPVGREATADRFVASGAWYDEGVSIDDVVERRSSLLHSRREATATDVTDAWDGFLGVQREVAIADRPVDVEVDLATRPDLAVDADGVAAPAGPRAPAETARLTSNPHVPRAVERVLEDDDWRAEGAMTYLYRRGFDVYDVHRVLSAGALGRGEDRRLVPTRWSITAADDCLGRYLRERVRSHARLGEVRVHHASFLGNEFWVVLAPGDWEYELVEVKAPGSVWNPDRAVRVAADHEGYDGLGGQPEETAGAFHAARLGVLEHLDDLGRQASALVVRRVSGEYWAPTGVWLIRETVRDALGGAPATTATFGRAVAGIAGELPVDRERLRRASTLVAGRQARLDAFD